VFRLIATCQLLVANCQCPMVKTSVITIRDVAKEAGFSSTTVSIVLNNAPLARYIPAATKKRIEKAAKKLGYRPNLFARSLRSKRSHTVGVMVFDMTDPYCTLVLRGIENSLYQSSYLPILTDVHNERSRFERYLEMLLDRRVEALIVLANWLFVEVDVLADLERSSIPTIMIGRELQTDTVSSVVVDNEVGAYAAVEHLYLLGHRKIAFIRGPKTLADSAPRWRGIRSFAKSSGLELDPRLVLDLPESRDPISSFEAGYKLTEEWIKRKDRFYNPSLTAVRQPMDAMETMAVNIATEGINSVIEKRDLSAVHRKMVPEMVARESTRAFL